MHVRQQIRETMGTALTGLVTTGSNVFQSRVYPMQSAELPGLIIYTRSESSEPDTLTKPRGTMRTLQAIVEAYIKSVTGADDTADKVCAEVETAIANSAALDALTKDAYLSNTDISMTGDGDQPAIVVSMTFTIEYRTLETNAEVAI